MRPVFDRSVAEINGIVVSLPMNWALYLSVWVCVSERFCVCVCECIPPPFKHDPFQCSHHKLQDKSFWLITEWQLYVLCHQWTGYCLVIDYFYANQWIREVLLSICGPQTGVMFMSLLEMFEKTQIYSHLVLSRMLWGWKKKHIVVFFFLICNKKLCSYTCVSFALIRVSVGKLCVLSLVQFVFTHGQNINILLVMVHVRPQFIYLTLMWK